MCMKLGLLPSEKKMSENRVDLVTFGPKRAEVAGKLRKLCYMQRNVYSVI
jgi:hypothetical protein